MPGFIMAGLFVVLWALSIGFDWNETGYKGQEAFDKQISEFHRPYDNKWEKEALLMHKRNQRKPNRELCRELVAKLAKKMNAAHEKFKVVYGIYNDGTDINTYHVWIVYRKRIIDPTQGRRPKAYYKKTDWLEIEYRDGEGFTK